MSDILVKAHLDRIERIRNGTASIYDIQVANIEAEIFGRPTSKVYGESMLNKYIKVPDLTDMTLFKEGPIIVDPYENHLDVNNWKSQTVDFVFCIYHEHRKMCSNYNELSEHIAEEHPDILQQLYDYETEREIARL